MEHRTHITIGIIWTVIWLALGCYFQSSDSAIMQVMAWVFFLMAAGSVVYMFKNGSSDPESGEAAIEKTYQAIFDATPGDWSEKNYAGLLGAMVQRYRLSNKFVGNEHHQFEVIPFALMDDEINFAKKISDRKGLNNLSKYLLLQENPHKMDSFLIDMMRAKIELSIQQHFKFDDDDMKDEIHPLYYLMLSLSPFVDPDRVFWAKIINEFILEKIAIDAIDAKFLNDVS